ncbi:MAG: class I SAM-dependent methyltransferase [Armatimonadota bacterium]|nr:MAG: class I SAM-dependent methyltransferase [Armatimonadota bacterium]
MPDKRRTKVHSPPERFSTDITPLVYDVQFPPDAPDVGFWVEWCAQIGGPVLELGCGTGRIAIPLARAGLEVVGVDVSAPMLAAARKRLAAEPPEVRARVGLVQADMRDFHLRRQVACAIIPASTFAVLLTRRDQERTLANVLSSLMDNRHLAFDVRLFDDWLSVSREPPRRRASADGSIDFTEERSFEFDPATRVLTANITYEFHRPPGLGKFTERVTGRALSQPDVEEVLESAGFVVEPVWGDYDRSSVRPDSLKIIFVARKKP